MEWTSGYLNSPILQGGEVTILQNGDAFYPAMLEAIRKAKDSVNFEVYIFEPDEIGRQFMEAFKERARAGVEVRLLLDGFGGMKMRKRYRDELTEAGVNVSRFRPFGLRSLVRFYKRTHRRAIVIDGRDRVHRRSSGIEEVEGQCQQPARVARQHDPGYGPHGRGHPVRVRHQLGLLLRRSHRRTALLPHLGSLARAPAVSRWSALPPTRMQPIRLLFWVSFINARKRLWICNSYFIPDDRLRGAAIDRAEERS